jgi:hypothetical protein
MGDLPRLIKKVGPMARRILLLFACLYVLSIGGGFTSSDGEVMFRTTAALVERGTLALEPGLPQIVRGHDGRFYSKYDPGLPLLGVPFYVIGDQIGAINQAHRYRLAAIFYLLIPALAAAGTVAALVSLAGRLFPDRRALGVALITGLATILWPYARVLFAEAVLAFALTAAVMIVVRDSPPTPNPSPTRREGNGIAFSLLPSFRGKELEDGGHAAPKTLLFLCLAGIVFGLGVLTRAALMIYALPLVLLIMRLAPGWKGRVIRVGAFAAGLLPFVAILLWHNMIRFDDPLQFGYGHEGFTTPLWEGIPGLLFSPGKSIFLYAPPLILSLILWPRFRRDYPALGDFLALAWIVALVFYGAWWAWHGGWCWGPRLLVPLVPLSCLPLGKLPTAHRWRLAAAILIGLGVGVQILGVLTDVNPHYSAVVGGDESRYDLVNFVPQHSPLVGAIFRLAHGQTEPLAMFHLADTGLPATWTSSVPLLLITGLVGGIWLVGKCWGSEKKEGATTDTPSH